MARENHHPSPNTFYIEPLETWADSVQQLSPAAKQCFLEKVVHYKALSDMEHEFLVVYASNQSGSKIVLGIDRNAQDLATAASKKTSSSASQDIDTTQPSTAAPSARYLNTLACAKLPSLSSLEGESPHLAYDGVQASLEDNDAPIFAHHGPSVPLYKITFSSTSTSTSTSNSDARRRPSLLHLTILLLTIRTRFPSYDLLQHQCYFFARATCLALMDLYDGVERKLKDYKRAGTWRGVHVSVYSGGRKALQNMPLLPLIHHPVLIVPAGFFALYSAVKLYDGNAVGSEMDRQRIR